jgi:sialic acid synthase SpsE
MITIKDKNNKIQKLIDQNKEIIKEEKDNITLLHCRTIFATSDEQIIRLALRHLKEHMLVQITVANHYRRK